jgi:hypothetical protein
MRCIVIFLAKQCCMDAPSLGGGGKKQPGGRFMRGKNNFNGREVACGPDFDICFW